ncbi:MAG: carboxypeptidase regulatory-like domain-containing protein [Acidobacteria bacterium]|nr:carboxypeptidase regulatory-like domain-containing protein [Acidobacteriota bacterium]MBV9482994.1 carboxypeptidase regulatory-like domain-containing protein [Acidobacteriota bacterium]
MRRIAVSLLLVMALSPLSTMAGEKSAELKFLVIRDYNGKPVRNASVVLHPVDEGKQERGGFQLKTDLDGRTGFDGVPYGTLRIQVLAQGFQTFGQDYQVNQPEMEITIKLKRPSGQFSVYDDKNQGATAQDKKDKE